MILTKYFSRVYAASEQDQGDESAEDIYRFIPERHWTPEQRKIVDDWLQRKKEELRPITHDSEVRALWGSGKGFGSPRMSWDTAYVINYLDGVRTVGQLI